jgi:long-subunit fatty acid transport protein
MAYRLYLLGFCIFFISSIAKGEDKIHVQLDYNRLFGICEKSDFWSIDGSKYQLSGFDLNLTALYSINKRLSVGAGMSAEKLYNPSYTAFPVFAVINYAPLRITKPYLFAKAGYSIGTKISNPGFIGSTGVGYKLKFREHFGLNFMLGYHLSQIKYDITSSDNIIIDKRSLYRHSIALGIGFVF